MQVGKMASWLNLMAASWGVAIVRNLRILQQKAVHAILVWFCWLGSYKLRFKTYLHIVGECLFSVFKSSSNQRASSPCNGTPLMLATFKDIKKIKNDLNSAGNVGMRTSRKRSRWVQLNLFQVNP